MCAAAAGCRSGGTAASALLQQQSAARPWRLHTVCVCVCVGWGGVVLCCVRCAVRILLQSAAWAALHTRTPRAAPATAPHATIAAAHPPGCFALQWPKNQAPHLQ
jgi:hypothetical protein